MNRGIERKKGTIFHAINTGLYFLPVFFLLQGAVYGEEPILIKDINAGQYNSLKFTSRFFNFNNELFFHADDGTHGEELWKTDGTEAGTVLVRDINPGPAYSLAGGFADFNGSLFFRANDGEHGSELWKSDGTEAGTALLKDIRAGLEGSSPGQFTNVNGTLFFAADDGVHGKELWKSDGTEAGTVLVKDIHTGPLCIGSSCAYLSLFLSAGSTLLFSAHDAAHGQELWRSDGTEEGTVLVRDINPGPAGSSPGSWGVTYHGGTMFFSAYDGVHGTELWKSDGTTDGTVLFKDLVPGPDGSSPEGFENVNGTYFFVAWQSSTGRELWKTDWTEAGTAPVKDIYPGYESSLPRYLRGVNGVLFFSAHDGVHGRELWKSDGTADGTVLVSDINPFASSGNILADSSPSYLTDLNGMLIFSADDGIHGTELFGLKVPAFADVPEWAFAFDFIQRIYSRGITSGCKADSPELPGNDALYCPNDPVNRAQMAVFIIRALGEEPAPSCTGLVFADVNSVSPGEMFCRYIEKFSALGITSGCGEGNFCPSDPVTRAQIAVFILKALGEATDPVCEGFFSDVDEETGGNKTFCRIIERFFAMGITGGCGSGEYCPDDPVLRSQMAVFLTKAFL